MKKFAFILAAAVLAMSRASCGGDDKKDADNTSAAGDSTTPAVNTEADTTAAPVTTEEATTVETEPEKVPVYTPVAVDNFDDPENTVWKQNAQISNFNVADGYLTATSTGGDPSIATKADLNLNCDDIDVIRVRFLNGTANDSIQLFFTTDTNTGYSEEASFKEMTWNTEVDCDLATISERSADEWDEVIFYTEDNDLWTGTLKKIRLDLSNGEGPYVVDYISLDSVSYE